MRLRHGFGYDRINLTKMGDIIRSRTCQAFFPLIATTLLYFMISWLLIALLKAFQKRMEPRRSCRKSRAWKSADSIETQHPEMLRLFCSENPGKRSRLKFDRSMPFIRFY